MKELTKIEIMKCQDCGKNIQILTNQTSKIVAIRCPVCFKHFKSKNKKYDINLCKEHGYLVGHLNKDVRLIRGNKILH